MTASTGIDYPLVFYGGLRPRWPITFHTGLPPGYRLRGELPSAAIVGHDRIETPGPAVVLRMRRPR